MKKLTITSAVLSYIAHQTQKINLPKPFGINQKTVNSYYARAIHFREFFENNKIENITDITISNAQHLYIYLLNKKLEVSTANKIIKLLKTILEYCSTHLNILCNTLRGFKLSENRKPIKYLTETQLNDLISLQHANSHILTVDLFTIQCLTGFSYCDLMNFKKEWIIKHSSGKEFIKYKRSKTESSIAIIPLTDKLSQVLKKYDYQIPKLSNAKYNKHLKSISTLINFDQNLTTHIGRKTCGCIMLNNGYSIEYVSKILGHSSISTTQKYYTEIIEERMILEDNYLQKKTA